MVEYEKSQKKTILLFFLLMLIAAAFTYLPGINQLGYYRDDWNNIFNAYTQGPKMLIAHYESDRPADGYLLCFAYALFKNNPLPYLICGLICRFLSGFFFALALLKIWPSQKTPSLLAGLLFILFPGFLQQVNGIAYLPHQTAMLCAALSIYLSIEALSREKSPAKWVLLFCAALCGVNSMILMEYYIGIEGLRFLLFAAWEYNAKKRRWFSALLRSLGHYLPYLAGLAVFVFWRSFLFDATRNGTNVKETLAPLFANPKYEGLSLIAKILKNSAKLLFGAWTIPAHNLINSMNVKPFWLAFLWAFICLALLGIIWSGSRLLEKYKKTDNEEVKEEVGASRTSWQMQWLAMGFLGAIIALTPMILAGREINYASSLDRFTYHAAISAIIFMIGLIFMIPIPQIRFGLIVPLMLIAIMVQIINKENYIRTWRFERDFWWQLSWRAPDIREHTAVVANAGFSVEEDYELFAPLHLIYYPERDHAAIGAEVLNTRTLRDIEMGVVSERTVRKIYVRKDYNNLLALTKPTEKSCLQVIDGRSPVYSASEWSRITEAGAYSKLERIDPLAETHHPDERIFGKEPERGWCYYYQKMSLAQQTEDWEKASSLADEAISVGAHAEDWAEWLPLVQAYAYVGRMDDAKNYAEILKLDDYLQYKTCRYFKEIPQYFEKEIPHPEGQEWLISQFCE